MLGAVPHGIFINANNTVYLANSQNGTVQIWPEGSPNPASIILRNTTNTFTIFATETGNIYLNQWQLPYSVDVWQESTASLVTTLFLGGICVNIFIDINEFLYCTFINSHKVVKRSLNSSDNQLITVAGSDYYGCSSERLYSPAGMFVTTNLNLYVADNNNDRIQLFQPGQTYWTNCGW